MPVIVKKTCDQTLVEIYTCPAPDGVAGVPYVGVNLGTGAEVYESTDQEIAPREHKFRTLVGVDGTVITQTATEILIAGGGGADIEFATRQETDEGILDNKALNPDVGAYAYDRFRYPGQHAAGKGTEGFIVPLVAGVFTIDCEESNVFEIVLTQNATIASPINPIKGQTINVLIKQDATGGRTVTWGGDWTFFNGIPTLSTEAYATDMISCQWDDTALKWRCSFLTGFTAGVVGTGVPYTLSNIGTGAGVYKQTVDELGTDTAQLRSIVGGTGVTVTQNADDVTVSTTLRVFIQSTAPVNPQLNDLWFW
jgi:hypothetical protein